MAYPPGIPILAPGERITEEIINYIEYAKEKGCLLTGTEDMHVEKINVVLEWKFWRKNADVVCGIPIKINERRN